MAEIDIEKKKPIWPWIILVLVILALLYFLVFDNDEEVVEDENNIEEFGEDPALEENAQTTTWEDETGEVAGYLAHVGDESRMGIDHEYTNAALLELIDAVKAKAEEMNFDISADMQEVKQHAQKIEEDPMAVTHANTIKEAGKQLADILENMQEEEFPALSNEVQEVKTAASNIDGSVQTLDQKDQINKFFNEAGDVLKKMS